MKDELKSREQILEALEVTERHDNKGIPYMNLQRTDGLESLLK